MTAVQQRQISHEAPLVLVVDDGEVNRALVEAFLSDLDCRLQSAEDGQSALAAIERETPDLVLLDVQMPGMDGYEVCRRLRQQPGTAKALIVALTGWGQEKDRRLSRQAGFDHHLVKPVEPEALQALLAGPSPASPVA